MKPWPFNSPKNTATITTKQVIENNFPILRVLHDAEDGGWQVLCGTTNSSEDARVVSLESLYKRDESIGELADLPEGWGAWRENVNTPWNRFENNT